MARYRLIVNGRVYELDADSRYAAAVGAARSARVDGNQVRMRRGGLRRLYGSRGRVRNGDSHALLCFAVRGCVAISARSWSLRIAGVSWCSQPSLSDS